MNFTRPFFFSMVGLSLVCASGCGKNRGAITGKVTFENKPVVYGTVMVVDEANQPFAGPIDPDGTYTVKGVPYGEVRVTVSSPNPVRNRDASKKNLTPEMKELVKDIPKEGPAIPDGFDANKWFEIPVKYANHDTSGLNVTIGQPNTTFDIALKKMEE